MLPTGTGKTVVFSELIRRVIAIALFGGGRCLVIAHRTELLEQAIAKLHDAGVTAALDQAGERASLRANVVVASVQTLKGDRLRRYARDHFAFIVVDEAHHAAAAGYQEILAYFAIAKVLGATATPRRADGKPLGDTFDSVAFTYEMRRAMADKFLAPLLARRILVEGLDLSAVRTRAGDFDQAELSKILNDEAAVHAVVSPLVELAGDRKSLVFGVDVAHAKALAEVINRHKPGRAIALDGTATKAERKAVLALYRRGAFQFLCNCALYTEGFDEPDIGCVAIARPTQSWVLYTQMIGRGTRLHPSKRDCLVLDFAGNSARHRLIGPVDALAGYPVDELTHAAAEKALAAGDERDLETLLAVAEHDAGVTRDKGNVLALAEYRTREIDLFLGDSMPPFDPTSPAANRPATAEQLAEIDKAKLGRPPHGMSEAEAAAMLIAVKARSNAGLCTVPQARLLEKIGCNSKGVTFARAQRLIGSIASRDLWSTPWIALGGEPEWRGRKRA